MNAESVIQPKYDVNNYLLLGLYLGSIADKDIDKKAKQIEKSHGKIAYEYFIKGINTAYDLKD